jgi:hypothetical protein
MSNLIESLVVSLLASLIGCFFLQQRSAVLRKAFACAASASTSLGDVLQSVRTLLSLLGTTGHLETH